MSKKAFSAANQQGSLPTITWNDPSETTRRAPFSKKELKAYFLGALHDGTFSSNRRFRISQKGTEWLIILKRLLENLGYKGWIYQEGRNRDVYVLETLADFLDFKDFVSKIGTWHPRKIKTLRERMMIWSMPYGDIGRTPK